VFFFTLNIIPIVLGKTRKAYLNDFLYSTEIEGEGFKNGIGEGEPINEATAYALEILDSYDSTDLETHLETELEIMFDNDEIVLYELYYLLKSLSISGHSIEPSLKNRIHQFINGTEQISGGFAFSNTSTLASMSSTYFVVQVFNLIEEPIPNVTVHKDWIILCNNSDGGYGGNRSLSSTLLTTYYAVNLLEFAFGVLSSFNDLADINLTLTYLNSFYIQNPSDTNNFGGCLPDLTANYALISSTYHCVSAIYIINESMLNSGQTTKWVLSRQYFQDGGFADITEGTSQRISSVISSYYAFETLKIIGSLGKLSAEVFMVEFNYWILIIILGSIGLVAAIGVILWRRRRI